MKPKIRVERARAAPRRAQARGMPVRPLHRQVLPLFLAADRQPDDLERL